MRLAILPAQEKIKDCGRNHGGQEPGKQPRPELDSHHTTIGTLETGVDGRSVSHTLEPLFRLPPFDERGNPKDGHGAGQSPDRADNIDSEPAHEGILAHQFQDVPQAWVRGRDNYQGSRLVMLTRNTGLARSDSSIWYTCSVLAGSYSRQSHVSDSGKSRAPCAMACMLTPKRK